MTGESRRAERVALALVAVAGLGLSACGSDDTDDAVPVSSSDVVPAADSSTSITPVPSSDSAPESPTAPSDDPPPAPEISVVAGPFTVGTDPSHIAVGGGWVWVSEPGGSTVFRVDPLAEQAVDALPLTPPVDGALVGALEYGDGVLWVANHTDETVVRIDPDAGGTETIDVQSPVTDIVVGDGAVWIAGSRDNTVFRVDPATLAIVAEIPIDGTIGSITAGGGAAWVVSNDAGTGTVHRVDVQTDLVTDRVDVGAEASDIAFGADAVWVGSAGTSTVVKIDAADARTTAIQLGMEPSALAASDQAVWIAGTSTLSSNGALSVLDTRVDTVMSTVELTGDPTSIALDVADVWVLDTDGGDVTSAVWR